MAAPNERPLPVWLSNQNFIETPAFARTSDYSFLRGWLYFTTPVVIQEFREPQSAQEVEQNVATIRRQADLWFPLNHPHVLTLYGASDARDLPYFVLEDTTKHGTMAAYLEGDDHPVTRVWRLLYQVASGLHYLHHQHVVHGQLSLDGILIGNDGTARIGRLDLARRVDDTTTVATDEPTYEGDLEAFAMCVLAAFMGKERFAAYDSARKEENRLLSQPPEVPDQAWNLVQLVTSSKRTPLRNILHFLKELTNSEDEKSRCNKCGSAPNADARFCSYCGGKLGSGDKETPQTQFLASIQILKNELSPRDRREAAARSLFHKTHDSAIRDALLDYADRMAELATTATSLVELVYLYGTLYTMGGQDASTPIVEALRERLLLDLHSIILTVFEHFGAHDSAWNGKETLAVEMIAILVTLGAKAKSTLETPDLTEKLADVVKNTPDARTRELALGALAVLTRNQNTKVLVRNAGIHDAVFRMLLTDDANTKSKAISLAPLVDATSVADKLVDKALPTIAKLIENGQGNERDNALCTLARIVQSQHFESASRIGVVSFMVDQLPSASRHAQREVLVALASLVQDTKNATIAKLADAPTIVTNVLKINDTDTAAREAAERVLALLKSTHIVP